jgi:3-isopropylmalate/(R)-2-methylmalate dehydratase small subunit
MEKFTVLTGIAAPMLASNINTDLIAPSIMPGRTAEENAKLTLKDRIFANLRYHADGTARPDCVLNQPRYDGMRILLGGPNFGCGSSRETAVWSLLEYGIRCVIAPGYGDIFHDNAFQNGLLVLKLEQAAVERIAAALDGAAVPTMTVDLQRCVIDVPGLAPIGFALPQDRRQSLLEGLDQLSVMLRSEAEIVAFERRDAAARPWVYPG